MPATTRLPRSAIVVLLGLCFPYIIYAAFQAEESIENRPDDWLPTDFPETQTLRWLEEEFGGDELLMISYPGCSLDDHRLVELAEKLSSTTFDGEPMFRRIVTGSEMLAELRAAPLALSREEAVERLRGWILGPHDETCMVAMISSASKRNREVVLDEVARVAASVGLPADTLKMAGATVETVAINQASTKWYMEISLASLVICVTILYLCFRSVSLTLMLMGTALLSERLSLAWMHITDIPTDSVSTMTPALVFVLAVSTAVHLANYYRDELTTGGQLGASRRAVRNAWKPCLMATLTTAIGLGSLTLSDLEPVQRFGVFSALGVSGMLCVQFLVLPFLLERYPPRVWVMQPSNIASSDPLANLWERLAKVVESRHTMISGICATLLLIGAIGIGRLHATARLHNLLPADAPVLQDYEWLESHIGPLVPLEVVLRFSTDDPSSLLERAQFVEGIGRVVAATPDVGNARSATMWFPPLPAPGGGLRDVVRRTLFNRILQQSKDRLDESDLFRESNSEQLWRISAAAKASDPSLDYGLLMARLRQRVDPLLESRNAVTGANVTAVYTGSIPLMHKIQGQLLDDLAISFLTAVGLITLVMILVMRNPWAGLLCMIPNILPTVVVFGAMGWLGPQIEVGSMMTAGAAIGIAVDDTLHFMTWFRHGLAQRLNRTEAVRFAYRSCATAMLQTSLICGLGLLVFALSPFAPIARFGWMLAALLSTALLSDLIILPAILIGPLGAVFCRSQQAPQKSPSVHVTVVDRLA